jgi:mercuric ion binding protein
MKTVKILMMVAGIFFSANLFAQTAKTEKIKVYGNCAICKKNIETAAKTDGVSAASWNKKLKILTVSFDPARIGTDQIQRNIAARGYDTEKYKGDDKAYNELDPCCQYDRKDAAARH